MAVILVIEDDVALSDLLRQVLDDEGHRTFVASSLAEAGRVAHGQDLDLVVADLLEFDLRTGPGSVEALRAVANGCPVLLCTGQPDADRLAELPGVAGVLGKPFDLEHLLGAVNAALARGRQS